VDRRRFIAATGAASVFTGLPFIQDSAVSQDDDSDDKLKFTSGSSPDGEALLGSPVVTGPSHEAMTILQPLQRHATGYLEFAVGEQGFQRIDASRAGLRPFEEHVLKFQLPPLPPGEMVRYRVVTKTVGWVSVGRFVHGKIVTGSPITGPTHSFRTLDPKSAETEFVVWNDTHENETTLRTLNQLTNEIAPDFLLWNGDQSNDIHFPKDMIGQFLAPFGLSIANRWPLAYVRGNHDVRGPAARFLSDFTGTPDDEFYYAFRSGPVASLVMDTGEDKADDHPNFGGLAAFRQLRERQAKWLNEVGKQPWFREAPFKILFCHLPLWWIRDRKDFDWWEFSKVSRDVWLPGLLEAGIDLIISGHTHNAQWMPADKDQPIGQLAGGSPNPKFATLIHGKATEEKLTVTMSKLDGTVMNQLSFSTQG